MTQTLRRFTAFVAGFDTRLEITDVKPPLVRDQVDELKAGGLMAGLDIPLGLQKLEAGFNVNARSKPLMAQAGMTPGKHMRTTFRGVSISEIDGTQQNEVIIVQGRLNIDGDDWSAGAASKMDYKIGSITYYKHLVNGAPLFEIDLPNFICIVEGVDQWASMRSGLGL